MTDEADKRSVATEGEPLTATRSWVLGSLALVLLAAGSVSVFITDSALGAVALIVTGGVLAALWAFGDRVIMLSYKDYEIHLSKKLLESAELAEEEGADEAAETLRAEGMSVLGRSEEGQVSGASPLGHGDSMAKLARLFEQDVLRAVRQAASPIAASLTERDFSNRLQFDAIVRSGDVAIGIEIRLVARRTRNLISRILLGLHMTPGLRGVLVIVNSQQEDEVEGLGRYLDQELAGAILTRVVGWAHGDEVAKIRSGILEVLQE